ncbi:MAG: RcnB family protein, partial [Comamonas sp.]
GHGHAGPDRHDRHDRYDRRDDRRPGPPPHAHGGRHGAGPQHNWVRGSRIPPQYRTRHYVVNDWRGHHLSPPPRGYHWVQNGGDYLLVAIATGVIAQLILSQ